MSFPNLDNQGIGDIQDSEQLRRVAPKAMAPAPVATEEPAAPDLQGMNFQPGSAFPLQVAAHKPLPVAAPAASRPAPAMMKPTAEDPNSDLVPNGAFARTKPNVPVQFMTNFASASPNSYYGKVFTNELKNIAGQRKKQAAADTAEIERQQQKEAQTALRTAYSAGSRGEPLPEGASPEAIKAHQQGMTQFNQARAAGIHQTNASTRASEAAGRSAQREQKMQITQRDMDWQDAHPDGYETITGEGGKTYYRFNTGHGRYHVSESKPLPGNPEPVRIDNLDNGDQIHWFKVGDKIEKHVMKAEKAEKPSMVPITEVSRDGRTKTTRHVLESEFNVAVENARRFNAMNKEDREKHGNNNILIKSRNLLGQRWSDFVRE